MGFFYYLEAIPAIRSNLGPTNRLFLNQKGTSAGRSFCLRNKLISQTKDFHFYQG